MLVNGTPALLIGHKTFRMHVREYPAGLAISMIIAIGSILFFLALSELYAGVTSVLAAAL